MIYLVSKQTELFKSDAYEKIDPNKAIELLSKESILGADTETTGLNPVTSHILTIQLGNEDFQIVWDCTSYPITLLKRVLENPDIKYIWHNYCFDGMFLLKEGIVQTNYFDTLIGERVLNNGKPRDMYSVSLKACALKYCDYDMDKTARGEIISKGLTERTIVYSATDVKYSIPIYEAQQKELEKYEVKKAAEFESKFTIVVAYTKLCGVKLDVPRWKKKMAIDEEKREKWLSKLNSWIIDFYSKHNGKGNYIEYKALVDTQFIHPFSEHIPDDLHFVNITSKNQKLVKESDEKYGYKVYSISKIPFGYTANNTFHPYIEHIDVIQQDLFAPTTETFGDKCVINWSSSNQVIPLFELLGFNVETLDKKTKQTRKSADKTLIAAQKNVSSIAELYVKYKEAAKVCEAFGKNFLDNITPEDGRIHADFNPIGADTFRMSCGGSKGGVNLQQLPSDAETRACFISEKGNKWISVDYEGQESRLIASVTGDKALINIFTEGCGDVHSLVAYMTYPHLIPRDTKIEDIKKKYHNLRQDAKKVEFAINYAGNEYTIANNGGIPIEEAKVIYNNYMKGFPGMEAYQKYCKKDVMERGYIQMNNVTGAKAFAYDWDRLSQVQEEMKDPNFWSTYKKDPILKEEYNYYKKRKAELGKQSVNYRIQNRGAGCFKLASMLMFKWVVDNNLLGKVKFCIPVHDEWNIEAPDDIAQDVAKVLLKCMEKGAKPFCDKLPLPGDLSTLKDGTLPNYWIH